MEDSMLSPGGMAVGRRLLEIADHGPDNGLFFLQLFVFCLGGKQILNRHFILLPQIGFVSSIPSSPGIMQGPAAKINTPKV